MMFERPKGNSPLGIGLGNFCQQCPNINNILPPVASPMRVLKETSQNGLPSVAENLGDFPTLTDSEGCNV